MVSKFDNKMVSLKSTKEWKNGKKLSKTIDSLQ
jgi:hypothetical protein